jgi:uncharacterized protein YecE (DUF72 family)
MTRRAASSQLPLFGGAAAAGESGAAATADGAAGATAGVTGTAAAGELRGVRPAAPSAVAVELAAALPAGLHLGGSTWSFPGWAGTVYEREYAVARLARDGLPAYARHPLLTAAGLDRTHYRPLAAVELGRYALDVPAGFLFLVKAHDVCTLARFPDHPRYGAERGQVNPRFLDPAYAAAEVVAPYVEGLAAKGGALLFQFAPQDLGEPRRFAARLHAFVAALPRGPRYAVELRNRELLTADYAAALVAAGACHCLTVHPRMPPVEAQARLVGAAAASGGLGVGRWLLGASTYEETARRFTPFNRMVAPDTAARGALAGIAGAALAAGRGFLLTVNNNAEGCAPLSIVELARAVVEAGGGGSGSGAGGAAGAAGGDGGTASQPRRD